MKFLVILIAATTLVACVSSSKESQQPPTILQNEGSLLMTGWYHVVDSSGFKRRLDRDTVYYYLDPAPIVTAHNIREMEIYEINAGDLGLAMYLNQDVADVWEEATARAAMDGTGLAFIVDDKLFSVPRVNGPVAGGTTALNRGIYSRKELEKIMQAIQKEMALQK